MSDTETDTTLCSECQTPVDMPQVCQIGPFLGFRPIPLCKDCLYVVKDEHFSTRHRLGCPFKTPHWRPKR